MTPIDLNVVLSIGIPLLGLAVSWGSLWAKLNSIQQRLDVSNGRLNNHSSRLTEHGEKIATLEGRST